MTRDELKRLIILNLVHGHEFLPPEVMDAVDEYATAEYERGWAAGYKEMAAVTGRVMSRIEKE